MKNGAEWLYWTTVLAGVLRFQARSCLSRGDGSSDNKTDSLYICFHSPFFQERYRCYRLLFYTDNIRLTDNCLFLLAFSRLVIDVIDVIGSFRLQRIGVRLGHGSCR